MKVLFITRKFPPSVGGMENFAKDLYDSIDKVADIELIKWGGSNKLLPIVYPWLMTRATFKLAFGRYDIIHAQDGVVSIYCALLKVLFKKPLVVVIHGLDVTYRNKIYQRLIKRTLKKSDKIICISKAAAKEVKKRDITKDKIQVITLGINKPKVTYSKKESIGALEKVYKLKLEDKKIILSVGRLVKRKGVGWFIENVMPKLIYNDSRFLLFVSGEGEQKSIIQSIVKDNNLQDNVILLGRTSDHTLNNLWFASDIFIMPNITVKGDIEGFGIVLLEASSRGLPVIASPIEGILDATHENQNAFYVESENSDAWAIEIIKLFDNHNGLNALGRDFQKYTLENYSWPKIAEEYAMVYRLLC